MLSETERLDPQKKLTSFPFEFLVFLSLMQTGSASITKMWRIFKQKVWKQETWALMENKPFILIKSIQFKLPFLQVKMVSSYPQRRRGEI